MKRPMRKLKTFIDYASVGIRVGATWRSKLILASLLPLLKLRGLSPSKEKVYALDIRLGTLMRTLYMRAQDILIVREVFGENPYLVPDMKKDSPPRCIIDLGAHIGLATLQFKAAFPDTVIHCYEPDPDNFHLLRLNTAGLPGVVLHREAVGGVRAELPFYVRRGRHASSSLYSIPGVGDTYEIRCEVKLLDDCLREAGLPVDVVKFDIEGAEVEVFSRSRLIHDVRWITGELKRTREEVQAFLALFPEHEPSVRWNASGMAYVTLVRRAQPH